MEGATLGSGIAKAPKAALDMSQEARMARAAEQGFDTSKTLYHGTSNEFDKFKTNRAGITYLTDKHRKLPTFMPTSGTRRDN